MNSERHPLEPFLPAHAQLLMLGSFPPKRIRWSMDFFYPNLQNDMWRIVGYLASGDRNHFLASGGKAFDRERSRASAATSIPRRCWPGFPRVVRSSRPDRRRPRRSAPLRAARSLRSADLRSSSSRAGRCGSTACRRRRGPIRVRWSGRRSTIARYSKRAASWTGRPPQRREKVRNTDEKEPDSLFLPLVRTIRIRVRGCDLFPMSACKTADFHYLCMVFLQ